MHRAITLLATWCAASVAAAAAPAQAQAQGARIVTCASYNGRLRKCRIPEGSRVRIVARLGAAECRANGTWGVRRGYIWVDGGCRGRFAVVAAHTHRVGGGHKGGYPDNRRRYEHQRGEYGHGAGHGGYPHAPRGYSERGLRGELGHAQRACVRRAQAARLRVRRVGDWWRERGGVLRVELWVRGRRVDHRVQCVYDPHRGARLYWPR